MNAVDGDGESAPGELVEKRVAPLAAVCDAGEGGILALHAETRMPHDQHEEPRLALREAVIGNSLNAFGGCH